MANPCTNCPAMRKQKRAASIHGKVAIREGWGHEYADGSPAGLQAKSEGRRNYERSQAHQQAYEHVEGQCIFFAGGAPTECWGEITPGHIVPRSVTGRLEISDEYPVAPQCQGHNQGVETNPELREWAQTHTFMWHDGRLWFYRYNDVMYRELKAELASSTSTANSKSGKD